MRRLAWALLLLLVFSIPWEYSLDFGEPWGNVSRVLGLTALLALIPALCQAGRLRRPGAAQVLALAYLLWCSASVFWSADVPESLTALRGLPQQMMVFALIWELAETRDDLSALMQAYVAGTWVLVVLTLSTFLWGETADLGRYVPAGQDPNDVARYMIIGIPFAALAAMTSEKRITRWMRIGYVVAGGFAVVLTASRSGFLALGLTLGSCAILLMRKQRRMSIFILVSALLLVVCFWMAAPVETLDRLATIPQQLGGGDLNQRWNIWAAGWQAFVRAPVAGQGAGSFVAVTGLSPIDTAHNSALSIAVETGLVGLLCMAAIVGLAFRETWSSTLPIRGALMTALAAWVLQAAVTNVQNSRSSWMLLALALKAGELGRENADPAADMQIVDRTAGRNGPWKALPWPR